MRKMAKSRGMLLCIIIGLCVLLSAVGVYAWQVTHPAAYTTQTILQTFKDNQLTVTDSRTVTELPIDVPYISHDMVSFRSGETGALATFYLIVLDNRTEARADYQEVNSMGYSAPLHADYSQRCLLLEDLQATEALIIPYVDSIRTACT